VKRTSLIVLLLTVLSAHAEEIRYISDEFEVPLRTGKTFQNKILKNLATGTKIEVLEVDGEAGYSMARTADGTEGWIESRFLSTAPVAKTRLQAAETQIQTLRQQLTDLKNELAEVSKEKSNLEKESSTTSKNKSQLEKELENIRKVSANQIAIAEENESLKTQLLNARREMQSIQQENMTLQDKGARDWFLIGAGVCVGGIILGLVLPNIRFKRKNSWGSL
jgi:SH3 domain protein